MMLSMPSTTSRVVNVSSAIQISGSVSQSMPNEITGFGAMDATGLGGRKGGYLVGPGGGRLYAVEPRIVPYSRSIATTTALQGQ